MKVLYDISVLGAGHYTARARTGIFRVVENVALGLATASDCDLTFCAAQSVSNFCASLDYLTTNPRLQDVPFAAPAIGGIRKDLNANIRSLSGRIDEIENSSRRKPLRLKAFRKALHYTDRVIGLVPTPVIEPTVLNQAEIYHSPFYSIPDQVKRLKNKKQFLTVYDLIPILYPQYFKFNERETLTEALGNLNADDWVLCISQTTKDDLCNFSEDIDPSKVLVTHLAASSLFYPCLDQDTQSLVRSKYSIPDAPYILSLCTLEPRKNIDQTIRSFARLIEQEDIGDLNLVLVGTFGWNYDKILTELDRASTLKDRIIVTGYVHDEDLAPLYSGALAFVYPSLYEGFGLPPLEAMQCGVPVITSNTSALPEVVGEAGVMVAPRDTDALCQSILAIYNDSDLQVSLSRKSMERAKEFSWDRCTRETINAYRTALMS